MAALRHNFANIQIEELFYEIIHGNNEAALRLTESLKVKDNINQKVNSLHDRIMQTCLHAACHRGNLQLARRLLLIGADPDLTDSFQSTPLHNAASEGNLEVVKLLVEYKANVHKLKVEKNAFAMARMYGKNNVVAFLEQFEACSLAAQNVSGNLNCQAAGSVLDKEEVEHQFSYTEQPDMPKVEAVPVEEDNGHPQELARGSPSERTSLEEQLKQLQAEVKQLKLNQSSKVPKREHQTKWEVIKERIHQNFEGIVENVNGADHLDYLFQERTISVEDYEKLDSKSGQREKTRSLMLMLLARPANQWVFKFMKSLEKQPATCPLARDLLR